MLREPGLRGKLLLAFMLIAGLPALAGFLGLIELRGLARSQSDVIRQTIPAIANVRGITEESTRIIAIAPRLAEVDTQDARKDMAEELFEQVAALSERLSGIELERGARVDRLRNTVTQVESAVHMLDGLVETRIAERAVFRRRVARDLQAATQLLDMADTLVANAEMGTGAVISSLYGETNTGAQGVENVEVLDKLLEVDLFQLSLMFELRSRTAEIGLLINRIDKTESLGELDAIQASVMAELSVIARRIAAIRDPGRLEQAESLLSALRSVTDDRIGLFDLQRNIIETESRISTLKEDLQNAAIGLGDEAVAVADRAQQAAIRSGGRMADEMRMAMTRNGAAALAGLGLAAAVLWFFVRGHITRRLDRLHGAMIEIASGKLDRPIHPKGRDEIARMERATETFREQAIAKRNLEKQRDLNEKELLEHRNNLQRMVADRTEQLHREVEAHDDARRKAEAADRAKSEFLAMMSHEIRTPMNGMLGLLRSVSDDPLPNDQRQRVGAALASGQNLLQILNDILDYSKIEQGGVGVVETTFSLHDLMTDIIALMRPSAEAKGIRMLLDMPSEITEVVRGDLAKLRQILFNLLSNALKFTDEGEVILRLRVSGADAQKLVFEVSDTGKGVSEEARARVFEAFEQEDDATGSKFGGTGLGLTISKRFADALGATLTLESTKGVGSVFTLSLDLPAGDPADLEDQDVPCATGRAAHALDVLVVEDNEINQMVARRYLERMGHGCQCLSSAEAALELLQHRPFDLVLMDVNLPGLNGLEATRRIRGAPDPALACVPVIGISAHVQEEQIDTHLKAGMNAFVAKPISPERLAQAIETVMRGGDGAVFPSLRMPSPKSVSRSASMQAALRESIEDFGDDRACEIAWLFLDQIRDEQERIETALYEEDWKALGEAAHRTKGMVGNYAQFDMMQLLAELEANANPAQRETARLLVQQLSRLVPKICMAMSDALAGMNDLRSYAM